jgi:hypothetical protein
VVNLASQVALLLQGGEVLQQGTIDLLTDLRTHPRLQGSGGARARSGGGSARLAGQHLSRQNFFQERSERLRGFAIIFNICCYHIAPRSR